MRSMSTSWPNSWRKAKARCTAARHASTASALTWMMGTSKPLARSDAHRVERASSVSVVKPTWLLVDEVEAAADAVAVERLQVQGLR